MSSKPSLAELCSGDREQLSYLGSFFAVVLEFSIPASDTGRRSSWVLALYIFGAPFSTGPRSSSTISAQLFRRGCGLSLSQGMDSTRAACETVAHEGILLICCLAAVFSADHTFDRVCHVFSVIVTGSFETAKIEVRY